MSNSKEIKEDELPKLEWKDALSWIESNDNWKGRDKNGELLGVRLRFISTNQIDNSREILDETENLFILFNEEIINPSNIEDMVNVIEGYEDYIFDETDIVDKLDKNFKFTIEVASVSSSYDRKQKILNRRNKNNQEKVEQDKEFNSSNYIKSDKITLK